MGTVILVGDILAGGAALNTSTAPDPTVVRELSEAALPAFGAIGFVLTALFLATVGAAIRATQLLPRWASGLAFIVALLNVAAVPTIYGGNDFLAVVIAGGSAPMGFYSYSSVIAGLAFILWLLLVSVGLVAGTRRVRSSTTSTTRESARADA